MAHRSYVESLFGPLPPEQRAIWKRVWDYVLTGLQFGPAVHQTRAMNHQSYYLTGTTHATANTEFSIAHGLGRIPYLAIPVLPLTSSGVSLVPLTVPRAADGQRVYLSSSSTGATVWVLVE